MNHVSNNINGSVYGSVIQADSIGSLHLTHHHHGHVTPNASPAGTAARETVIQIAGQTFSRWDEAAAYAKRGTADHDASAAEADKVGRVGGPCALCWETITAEDHDPAHDDGMCARCRAYSHTTWATENAPEFADCRCTACRAYGAQFVIDPTTPADYSDDAWGGLD